MESERFATLEDLQAKLEKEKMPSGFIVVKMPISNGVADVLSIRLEQLDQALGLPVIERNLTIYEDFCFRMHVAGAEVPLQHANGLTAKSGSLQSTAEVLNVLARLKSLNPTGKNLIASAADLLDRAAEAEGGDELTICQFVSEQLRLASVPAKGRRYSQALMSLAVVWDRTSPKLYEDLCRSTVLVLPHRKTLRRLTSALSVREGLEIGTINYLKMRVARLSERERLVNLAMDEVYTARAVELAGGRLYGEGKDGVTSTIFCTLISSVAGNYEDIISMSPVTSITTADIRNIFFKVLKTLTAIGFTVVSCTTDGHRTNQGFHNSLGEDGRHPEFIINPYKPDARVYTMYDSVHLYKNFFFNLLNKKALSCQLPSTGTVVHAQFKHLQQLYKMEMGQDIKMAYRLTDRVIYPTSVERVNVQLAVAATHESTVAALRFYSQKEEHRDFGHTADFLEMLRKWFSIVNVKTAYTHVRLHDSIRAPPSSEERCGLNFLINFEKMLKAWQDRSGGGKMSTDTSQAAVYTCRGLVGVAQYLLEKHSDLMHYVLLGKIQSDRIESRFGYLRKLAGGNYWASVRQFLEGEAVIRVKSLIWLSGYSLGTVSACMAEAQQQRQRDDAEVVKTLVEFASCAEHETLSEGAEQAIIHVAGYLARSALKKKQCRACQALLVNKEPTQLQEVCLDADADHHGVAAPGLDEAIKTFTDLLNRGRLLCPSELAVNLSMKICLVYRYGKLLQLEW